MTTPPPESSTPPVIAPTPEESRAIASSLNEEEIRALAQQLQDSLSLGYEPATMVKGIVTAIDFSGAPPTVTIQISGDTTTEVVGVRIFSHYSPQINDTVHVLKQGSDIVVLGRVANSAGTTSGSGAGGWVRATLSAGSHNAYNNGDVFYRRILDNGTWKMQWRGGWAPNGATTMVSGLPTEYRPTSGTRTVLCSRDADGSNVVKMDFSSNGTASLSGTTTTPNNSTVSGDVWFGGGLAVGSHFHQHTDWYSTTQNLIGNTTSDGGFSVGSHDHGFSGGSHAHAVSHPVWVSLNGVEYFL